MSHFKVRTLGVEQIRHSSKVESKDSAVKAPGRSKLLPTISSPPPSSSNHFDEHLNEVGGGGCGGDPVQDHNDDPDGYPYVDHNVRHPYEIMALIKW